ncbi:gp039 [Erwinia phage vB_EamP-S6]|uniref:Gp039 n=1 Tax=Erwinia phage vB_EamP-S6 TaxID=1051675 RepID=G0YQD1_9CAUD|nr:gp039 [Erwinia phage vB_EamP-S6]AEJ81558.1 gp039 [Erwinia phage vB_EamP-S6]
MPLIAAFAATFLMFMSGYVYDQTHTDTAFLVTNLYIMTALILCGMVRKNAKRRKTKAEPSSSSSVSPGTKDESSKD